MRWILSFLYIMIPNLHLHIVLQVDEPTATRVVEMQVHCLYVYLSLVWCCGGVYFPYS